MSKSIIILGAGGRFGRAACNAFLDAGWQVHALVRNPIRSKTPEGVKRVLGDALDRESLEKACAGMDVIINTVNPAYELWEKQLPIITENVIAAAVSSGATVVIPGNVYNYGEGMPEVLKETSPHVAGTRKGKLRIEMELAYRAAVSRGVRTIILRSGDYIEREKSGNWFDSQITPKAAAGKFVYPGRTDIVHAWAYLPDKARALVHLLEKREELAPFDEFGYEGFSVSGDELRLAVQKATGVPQKFKSFPWLLVRFIALFSAHIREVLEMRYLWNKPHRVDGSKLDATIPGFKPTPIDEALKQVFS